MSMMSMCSDIWNDAAGRGAAPPARRASSESGARAIETRRRGRGRDRLVLRGVAADGERRRVRSFIRDIDSFIHPSID